MSSDSPHGLRSTWATPEPFAAQVLVRRTAVGRWRGNRYEMAYYPEGLASAPLWVREVRGLGDLPGRTHPTDLHDLAVLLDQAAAEGDDRRVAWPVHHPAVVRVIDLREPTPAERSSLDAWRARQRADAEAAGPAPIRLHRQGKRDRVVDGAVHALTAPDRTRCGLQARDTADLGGSFSVRDQLACRICAGSPAT